MLMKHNWQGNEVVWSILKVEEDSTKDKEFRIYVDVANGLESEEEALLMANKLAERGPGTFYLVMKSTHVVSASVDEPKTMELETVEEMFDKSETKKCEPEGEIDKL